MFIKFLTLYLILKNAQSDKILGHFAFPSYSHQVVFQAIYKELCARGHEVVAITTNPLNDPQITNLKEIDVGQSYSIFEEMDITHVSFEEMSLRQVRAFFMEMHEKFLRLQFNHPEVKKLMDLRDDYFDLILVEPHHMAAFAWQSKFKVPLIAISTMEASPSLGRAFGISEHPIAFPIFKFGELSLRERFEVAYSYLEDWIGEELVIKPNANILAREVFGDNTPSVDFLVKNASLLITNMSPLLSRRKPLVPNVVQISQIHIGKKKPLPKDLQRILDGAVDGAVYFSLGTNVKFNFIPRVVQENIMEALGEIPYIVLCKWDSTEDIKIPSNVVVRKWFPQFDVLGHPNIKAFVTQGGVQSLEESVLGGVPMVVIPFLGDQTINAKILEAEGVAVQVQNSHLTKKNLMDAVIEVITNVNYKKNVEKWKNIFNDKSMTGAETAAWWCEYVLRHDGAKHLSSPVKNIPLYQYFFLDLVTVIILSITIPYFIIKSIFR